MQCAITVSPLTPTVGAEVLGLHPQTVSDSWPQLRDAFRTHRLLVLRDLPLDEMQFTLLAQRLGPLEGRYVMRRSDGKASSPVHLIQNLDADGRVAANPYGNANYFWHTDKQYHLQPSLATLLQAMQIPPTGGTTEFADMSAAYEALAPAVRERIRGLRAVYSYPHMLRTCLKREPTAEEIEKTPPVDHPLVRTHPETGRASLFVGMYCCAIVGMPPQESCALLAQLQAHATDRRFVYAHAWQPKDLLMWDNRCLLHRAVADFDMARYRRVMRRTVVQGEVPV